MNKIWAIFENYACDFFKEFRYLHELFQQDMEKPYLLFCKFTDLCSLMHEQRGHWVIRHRRDIPPNTKVLPAVWSMKRKRQIATREIYKWKAWLNVHGGKQEKGINFWETYSPVVKWFSICFFLLLSLFLFSWHSHSTDRLRSCLPSGTRGNPSVHGYSQGIHHGRRRGSIGVRPRTRQEPVRPESNRPAGCGTSSFTRDSSRLASPNRPSTNACTTEGAPSS